MASCWAVEPEARPSLTALRAELTQLRTEFADGTELRDIGKALNGGVSRVDYVCVCACVCECVCMSVCVCVCVCV